MTEERPSSDAVRVLLVEDDPVTVDLISVGMSRRGYTVDATDSTHNARARLMSGQFDIVLLDVALPGESGLALCADLRDTLKLPVIIISGAERIAERIAAFDAGADDFVPKPFHVVELCARVEAVLRRAGRRDRSGIISGPRGLTLNLTACEIAKEDARARLTRSEVVLLRVLLENAGSAVSAETLSHEVWDYQVAGDANFIQQHISRLRRKLQQIGVEDLIETVYGVGYRVPLPALSGHASSGSSTAGDVGTEPVSETREGDPAERLSRSS